MSDFDYVSSRDVAKMCYEDQQAYFERVLKELDSGSSDSDDNEVSEGENMPPNVNCPRSQEPTIPHDIEIDNTESESDLDDIVGTEEDQDGGVTMEKSDDFFICKDGSKWYKKPPPLNREGAHNIFRDRVFVGPKPATKHLSEVDTFYCIMSVPIQDIICRNTNQKAEKEYNKWNAENPGKNPLKWQLLTEEELSAFIGILFVMGTQRANHRSLRQLWNENSYPLFRATMSIRRFQNILRFLRFDSGMTRQTRMETDKAAPIRDVFNIINENLKNNFPPYESITVDEQLFPYRGRTKFTQYMPSKPAKYGIKIWWACDSKTSYPLNGQIYTGKVEGIRDVNQGERIVKELVAPYKNTGRNVTTDNFFTTVPLANHLLSWNMSTVGTLKKKTIFSRTI